MNLLHYDCRGVVSDCEYDGSLSMDVWCGLIPLWAVGDTHYKRSWPL